jgi:hypothetical protein
MGDSSHIAARRAIGLCTLRPARAEPSSIVGSVNQAAAAAGQGLMSAEELGKPSEKLRAA